MNVQKNLQNLKILQNFAIFPKNENSLFLHIIQKQYQ